MSLVQKLISIILYVGQSSKMVIINIRFKIFMDAHVKTFQLKIVLCSKIIGISTVKANEPYNVNVNTLDKMGDHHDKEVLQWWDSLQKV